MLAWQCYKYLLYSTLVSFMKIIHINLPFFCVYRVKSYPHRKTKEVTRECYREIVGEDETLDNMPSLDALTRRGNRMLEGEKPKQPRNLDYTVNTGYLYGFEHKVCFQYCFRAYQVKTLFIPSGECTHDGRATTFIDH